MKANGQNAVQKLNSKAPANSIPSVRGLLSRDDYKRRFEEILGQRSASFIASITNATNTNPKLKECDPNSVISAAVVAATLDLPIDPNLGFSYIIPYGKKANFQLGYKAFVQLAIRSGQYATMNVTEVYEDELDYYNPLTEEIKFTEMDTWEQRDKGDAKKIVGYYAYFKLLNGFEKGSYRTVKQVQQHGKKYSKTYNYSSSLWKTDFNAMAKKTVLKLLLNRWGILSVEMQKANIADQASIKEGVIHGEEIDSSNVEYTDNPDFVDVEFVEVETKGDGK